MEIQSSAPPAELSSPGIRARPFSDYHSDVKLQHQNSTSSSLEVAASDVIMLADKDKSGMQISRPGASSTTADNIRLENKYCMDVVLVAVLVLLERYNPDTEASFLYGPSGLSPLEAPCKICARRVGLEKARPLLDIVETVHSIRQTHGAPQDGQTQVYCVHIREDFLPTGTARPRDIPVVRVPDAFFALGDLLPSGLSAVNADTLMTGANL